MKLFITFVRLKVILLCRCATIITAFILAFSFKKIRPEGCVF